MPADFPNELLLIIVSDVLGTYAHSHILLPPHIHRWPAHYILRSVSRHFKALVDSIWNSAVGSAENWHEFRKLRMAINTAQYDGPEPSTTSPLIRAYGAYVVALILQQDAHADIEKARKAYESQLQLAQGWFHLAYRLSQAIRPLEFSRTFENSLIETVRWDCIESSIKWIELMIQIVVLSGAEADILKLIGSIDQLKNVFEMTAPQISQIDQRLIVNLKDVACKYQPSLQHAEGDESQESTTKTRRQLADSIKWLTTLWSTEYEATRVHKLAMYRAVGHRSRQDLSTNSLHPSE